MLKAAEKTVKVRFKSPEVGDLRRSFFFLSG